MAKHLVCQTGKNLKEFVNRVLRYRRLTTHVPSACSVHACNMHVQGVTFHYFRAALQ